MGAADRASEQSTPQSPYYDEWRNAHGPRLGASVSYTASTPAISVACRMDYRRCFDHRQWRVSARRSQHQCEVNGCRCLGDPNSLGQWGASDRPGSRVRRSSPHDPECRDAPLLETCLAIPERTQVL